MRDGCGAGFVLDYLTPAWNAVGIAALAAAALTLVIQAFLAAQLGLWLGTRVGERFREAAERVAGIPLIALGLSSSHKASLPDPAPARTTPR